MATLNYKDSNNKWQPIPIITIDSTLSDTSENPVANWAIKQALDSKQNELKVSNTNIDVTPIEGSENPITSGGVYSALQNIPTGGNGSNLPEVDEDDIGKFLRVSKDLIWVAENIRIAEEGRF